MSLIDHIKRDREAGTPGPWVSAKDDPNDGPEDVIMAGEYYVSSAHYITDHSKTESNARRIARVPDMEAALLAAENLANAVSVLSGAACLDDDGSSDWENMRSALDAYRDATKQA